MISSEKWRAYYSPVGRIRMLAGNPALDLANTLHWRDGELLDFVSTYNSLVDWAEVAGLLTEAEQVSLLAKTAKNAEQAHHVLTQWQSLRTALKVWLPTINGKDQTLLNSNIQDPAAQALLTEISAIADNVSLSTFYGMGVSKHHEPSITLPLLRSANAIWNLMRFPPPGLVRQCEADSCGGYFVDQSRAKPRRWCSMDSCGNRAKAERYRKSSKN